MKVYALALSCLSCSIGFAFADDPDPLAAAARKVRQLVAHRGSSADRPENTLASYRRAIDAGATAVEMDLRTTRDGVLVSLHDADMKRTTNGKGQVGDLTLEELQRLDAGGWFHPKYAGERVPTFREILELCGDRIDVLLDLKESGDDYAQVIATTVRKHGVPKKTIVGVRSVEQARQFRKLLPEARQLALIPTPDSIDAFAEAGVDMIRLWPKWLKDADLVKKVRKHGVLLHINGATGEEEEIRSFLRFEPNSLSSDDPARLRKSLGRIAK